MRNTSKDLNYNAIKSNEKTLGEYFNNRTKTPLTIERDMKMKEIRVSSIDRNNCSYDLSLNKNINYVISKYRGISPANQNRSTVLKNMF